MNLWLCAWFGFTNHLALLACFIVNKKCQIAHMYLVPPILQNYRTLRFFISLTLTARRNHTTMDWQLLANLHVMFPQYIVYKIWKHNLQVWVEACLILYFMEGIMISLDKNKNEAFQTSISIVPKKNPIANFLRSHQSGRNICQFSWFVYNQIRIFKL